MLEQTKDELAAFVDAAKAHGASDEFLVNLLERRGWPGDHIYSILTAQWERSTGLNVPERRGRGENSRDAFLYLLAFSTLSTWTCSLGSMVFHFIDRWFPDPVSNSYLYMNLRSAISWQMAGIAISFPIFLFTMRWIVSETAQRPERLESGVRKWLTYIALLGTAGTMIGDLIWILAFALQGELTTRFLLKALTVMSICGGVFSYYIGSLRQRQEEPLESGTRNHLFAWVSTAVVAASLVTGMLVAGTPHMQRRAQADSKRVADLRAVAHAIKTWNDIHQAMPANLAAMGASVPTKLDPETNEHYEYKIRQGTAFDLCATFATPSDDEAGVLFWRHPSGHYCYTLDAANAVPWQ